MHGAELHSLWIQRGGTDATWRAKACPRLRQAGSGPLYTLTPETLESFLSLASE